VITQKYQLKRKNPIDMLGFGISVDNTLSFKALFFIEHRCSKMLLRCICFEIQSILSNI